MLNGYVGFANLPKQWHRKSIRRGFSLNIMAIGESGLGKATLINTLFNRDIITLQHDSDEFDEGEEEDVSVKIKSTQAEIEEDGVKLKVSVITAPGFGESINNVEAWKPIVDEINSRFDSYLEAESRINRTAVVDNRVHAFLYFIEPTGHSLRALDIALMKQVHEKVNLIPVIAKSDTLTDEEILEFKHRILADISHQGIKIFKPTDFEYDEEESANTRLIIDSFPFAVVGSTNEVQTPDGRLVRGRKYPWGVVEVENDQHCDFKKLRSLLLRTNMLDLVLSTNELHFETFRSVKLGGDEQENGEENGTEELTNEKGEVIKKPSGSKKPRRLHNPKFKEEEDALKKFFTEQVKAEEHRFRQWETNIINERNRLNQDLEEMQSKLKSLEEQVKRLQIAKR